MREDVRIPVAGVELAGMLEAPEAASGLVIFAHGSGSSRLSPRNRQVATALREAGMATLLFDLLTEAEETQDRYDAHLRFDVELLAERLWLATEWAIGHGDVRGQPIGYFGASTGAAAAIMAATASADAVSAVVSRGGRPDLAGDALARITAPTLLIVGERDEHVLELNRGATMRMRCTRELVTVPGATHLFEEPGTLEQVCELAIDWYRRYLLVATAARPGDVHAERRPPPPHR